MLHLELGIIVHISIDKGVESSSKGETVPSIIGLVTWKPGMQTHIGSMRSMFWFYQAMLCLLPSTKAFSSPVSLGALVNEQMGHKSVADEKPGKQNHTGKHLRMFTWGREEKRPNCCLWIFEGWINCLGASSSCNLERGAFYEN